MIRFFLTVYLTFSAAVYAELVKEKAQGEIFFESNLFKPAQNSDEERAAIASAKKNALTKFAARTFDKARLELYQKVEPIILGDPDRYIVEYIKLNDEVDRNSKRYMVWIEATINPTMIENTINKNSAASEHATSTRPEASYMTFVYVAREVESRTAFAESITTEQQENVSGTESKVVADDGQSANFNLKKSSTSTVSPSTTTANNKLKYRSYSIGEVDNAVASVLTQARYEVVDPGDAGLDVETFQNDYNSKQDISKETRDKAIEILRGQMFRYFAIARMDVGLPEKDEVSGLSRVTVTVTAALSDLSPKIPKKVASIAGRPYSMLGSNPEIAKQNALNEAATRSASELVDQMRQKSIK